MAKETLQRSLKQMQRESGEVPMSSSSSSSFDSNDDDGDSTDEEYLKIIAGEEDDNSGETTEKESPFMKKLRESFLEADADADGTLTLQEFLRMQAAIPATGTTGGGLTQLVESNRMSDRMVALEAKVEANNQKLDRILALLQKGGAKKR
jgi:Ca2+-binding EF-hand superfamily protein